MSNTNQQSITLSTNIQKQLDVLCIKIKRQQLTDHIQLSIKTLELLQQCIAKHSFSSLQGLINELIYIGAVLTQCKPNELCINNIIRRVLSIIRTECKNSYHTTSSEWSTSKSEILDECNILSDEIRSTTEHIAEQAIEHIHSRDVVLTYDNSATVLGFLLEAKKLRNFEVVVLETGLQCPGHTMATTLAQHNIETTLITDSTIYALMSVINKVIISVNSVLADGTVVCPIGATNIVTVAKQFNIPVIILCGIHQLTPTYILDHSVLQQYGSSSELIELSSDIYVDSVNDSNIKKGTLTIQNPQYDIVTSEYISLYITNVGGHHSSYLYRLMNEYYHTEDYTLKQLHQQSIHK